MAGVLILFGTYYRGWAVPLLSLPRRCGPHSLLADLTILRAASMASSVNERGNVFPVSIPSIPCNTDLTILLPTDRLTRPLLLLTRGENVIRNGLRILTRTISQRTSTSDATISDSMLRSISSALSSAFVRVSTLTRPCVSDSVSVNSSSSMTGSVGRMKQRWAAIHASRNVVNHQPVMAHLSNHFVSKCLPGVSERRCCIHQALAARGLDWGFRPRGIVLLPPVPAKAELLTIPMKVFAAHFVIDPVMSSRYQRKDACRRVRVDLEALLSAPRVLPAGVVHRVVSTRKMSSDVLVAPLLVRQARAVWLDRRDDLVLLGAASTSSTGFARAEPSRSTSTTTGAFFVPRPRAFFPLM